MRQLIELDKITTGVDGYIDSRTKVISDSVLIALRTPLDGWEVRRQCGHDPSSCALLSRSGICNTKSDEMPSKGLPAGHKVPHHGMIWCGYTEDSKLSLEEVGYQGE